MLTGELPFQANSMDELKQAVLTRSGKNIFFPPNISISEDSKNLIRALLTLDQNLRISWKDFFNHPLFSKFREFAPAKNVLSTTLKLNDASKANNLNGNTPSLSPRPSV